MKRGAARRPIFVADEDRQLFLSILNQSFSATAVELHAYCLIRYAAVLIASDAHLLQASRYIYFNPAEARLVENAADWQWSSANAYLGGQPSPNLKAHEILAMFGVAGQMEYRRFLECGHRPTRQFYIQTWGQTHGSDPIRNGN